MTSTEKVRRHRHRRRACRRPAYPGPGRRTRGALSAACRPSRAVRRAHRSGCAFPRPATARPPAATKRPRRAIAAAVEWGKVLPARRRYAGRRSPIRQ